MLEWLEALVYSYILFSFLSLGPETLLYLCSFFLFNIEQIGDLTLLFHQKTGRDEVGEKNAV